MSKKKGTNKRTKARQQANRRPAKAKSAAWTFQQAQKLHGAGELNEAARLYRQILKGQPEHAEALHYLGVIAYQTGQLDQASELIERALGHRPDYPQALNNLGSVYFDQERYEQAERSYRQALELSPDNPLTHNNLGNALYWQRRLHEAQHCLDKAIELRPDYPEALNNLGNVLQELDDTAKAKHSFQRSLDLKPDFVDALINLGELHCQLKDFEQALECFEKAHKLTPDHPETLYHLGRLYVREKLVEQSKDLLQKAISIKPDFSEAYLELGKVYSAMDKPVKALEYYKSALALDPENGHILKEFINLLNISQPKQRANLGIKSFEGLIQYLIDFQPSSTQAHLKKANALKKLGIINKAEEEYRKILEKEPHFAFAYNNLGNLLVSKNKPAKAKQAFLKAIDLQPQNIEVLYNLGMVLSQENKIDEAEYYFKKLIEIQNDYVLAYSKLGSLYKKFGKLKKAENTFNKALKIKEEDVHILHNLGLVYHCQGKLDQAEKTLLKALDINSNFYIYNSLGSVIKDTGRIEDAKIYYQHALTINPNSSEVLNNIGNIFMDQGLIEQAMSYFDDALDIKPDLSVALNNYLLCSNYASSYKNSMLGPERLLNIHNRFGNLLANKYLPVEYNFENELKIDKKIRVGLVSPDLRTHSVSYFVESFLEYLDKDSFSLYCYADVENPDITTKRLASYVDMWHFTVGMSDDALVEQIKRDQIDLLIDLAGHTAKNRLLAFARKPAPVQVTWIGYPNTTGMRAMDYRITDAVADPPGKSEGLHTEALVRLPDCFLCYRPFKDAPEVMPYLSKSWEGITFGSFNKISKYSEKTIELWSRILKALPGSRLVLKSKPFQEKETRKHYQKSFAAYGVDTDRVIMKSWFSSLKESLSFYNQIDVALDSHPYNGTTTTCEALYMGVPVISLRGDRHAARVGASLLTVAGLEELIAEDEQEYVDKAVSLAQDTFRLQRYRSTIRRQILDSPLMDKAAYARKVEQAFRGMWRAYCDNPEEFMPVNTSDKTHAPEISDKDLVDLVPDEDEKDRQPLIETQTEQTNTLSNNEVKPSIRVLHHMARSGGTIISRCLGSMDQAMLLSEVHPLAVKAAQGFFNRPDTGKSFSPLHQAQSWFQLFEPHEWQEITQQRTSFVQTISQIRKRAKKLDKKLILRDWTHLDYTAAPFLTQPSYQLKTAQVLQDEFSVLQAISVRHPIDQWLSLNKLPIMNGHADIDQFLFDYLQFAKKAVEIGFVRYEDFTTAPDHVLQEICNKLQLPFDSTYKQRWMHYTKITGDTPNQRSSAEISPRPRKPIDQDKLARFTKNDHYCEALELLGYEGP